MAQKPNIFTHLENMYFKSTLKKNGGEQKAF